MKRFGMALVIIAALTRVAAAQSTVDPLRAAAKASPKDAAAQLALGKAERRAGQFAEAASTLLRGASLATARGDVLTALRWELVHVRTDQRDAKLATKACDAFTGAVKDACRAEAWLIQNRATEALPLARKALASEPSLYEAKVAEARALAMSGLVAEAEVAFKSAIAAKVDRAEAHRFLGGLNAVGGKRDAAVLELTRAAAIDGDDPEIQLELGQAIGAGKEARDAFARATKTRPTFGLAHAELARVALDLGETAQGAAAAEEAVKLDGSSFLAHASLARARVAQARWDDALKEGETAKRLLPTSAVAELAIADARAGKGDIDAAVEAYQRAFSLDRQDPSALIRATRACLAASRPTTARGFADKVTSEFPKWAPAWLALADAAEKQGDKAHVRSALETAMKSDGPIDKDATKKRLEAVR
jgi:tetratricopeptide (TPR) repeat protein